MQWAKQKRAGFTIVELLIVVVVIAILAAITVVGYSGIQQRAVNTARIVAARNTLNLLQAYASQNGSYPEIPENPTNPAHRAACLGTGWPTLQGVPVCWNIFTDDGPHGASTFREYESVNNALKTVGTMPNWPKQNVYEGTYGTGASERPMVNRGIVLVYRTVPSGDGVYPSGYSLAYIVPGRVGAADCGISGAANYNSSDPRHDFSGCVVRLPDV